MAKVTIEIDRPEGYEDVAPELVAEDFLKTPTDAAWNWRIAEQRERPAVTAVYTEAELKEFDRITLLMSSRDQVRRIEGRMAVSKFETEHGKEKCDAIFAEIQRREKKRK